MKNNKYDIEIAIIGGTGIYDPDMFTNTERFRVSTPFGATSDTITVGDFLGKKIAFISRHGNKHLYPPHKVPYKANIWALHELGVSRIIAPCAAGSLKEEIKPGQIVITDQFFDFTKGRDYTFYDGGKTYHIDVAEPFCEELRAIAISSARKLNLDFHDKGTNVTIQGPRYSTKAESNFFRNAVGADVIGMTLVPECILARELEMCYLSIAAITDYDVWTNEPVDAEKVAKAMNKISETIRELMTAMIPEIPSARKKCKCPNILDKAVH